MYGCDDPYGQERKGRDAARWGERYDHDHRERMRNATWESDSCDAHYAKGYKQEIERQGGLRREEEEEEERREAERQERLRQEERYQEGQRWEEEQERLERELQQKEESQS